MLPKDFTLTCRGSGSGSDDTTDIELRTPNEKFTIASDVDDRFAPLFLASPDLLTMLEGMLMMGGWIVTGLKAMGQPEKSIADAGAIIAGARAAVAKAKGAQ